MTKTYPIRLVDTPVRTAATDLFGTRFPIVAGGLQFLANADYAAGCAKAGIIGFLTANHFPDDASLRAEIREAQDLCGDLPFGVNIAMLPKSAAHERIEQILDVVAEEGVRFVETTGRSPDPYLPVLKSAGIKVLHKVPGLRYAEKAQSVGVDMAPWSGGNAAAIRVRTPSGPWSMQRWRRAA